MKIKKIICPAAAGAAAALGLLVACLAADLVRSYRTQLGRTDWNFVRQIFAEMEEEAAGILIASGVDPKEVHHERVADMRYAGQFYEIPSPIPSGTPGPEMIPRIIENFYLAYDQAFVENLIKSFGDEPEMSGGKK